MERRRILFLFVLTKHSVLNYLLQEILLTANGKCMGGKKLSMIIGGTGSNRSGNHLFRRWRLRCTWGIPSSAKPFLGWCLGRCICLTYQPSCTPLFGKSQEILLIMILRNMLHLLKIVKLLLYITTSFFLYWF